MPVERVDAIFADRTITEHLPQECPLLFESVSRVEKQRCPLCARLCCKSLFGGTNEILRAADAFCAQGREGPHRCTQKRPRTFVSTLQSGAAVEACNIQLSRDFWSRSIFDFCNTICQIADMTSSRLSEAALPQQQALASFTAPQDGCSLFPTASRGLQVSDTAQTVEGAS